MSTASEASGGLRRFLPYLPYLRDVRGPFAVALACAVVFGVASGFSVPVIVQRVFGRVFAADAGPFTHWQIAGYAALLPLVFFVRGLSGYLNSYFINLCGFRVLEQLRTDYFRQLQRLHLGFFHDRSSGDLISRGLADTNQLQLALTNAANEAVKQPVVFLGAVGALIYLSIQNSDVVFMLLCMASVPAAIFPIRIVGQNLLRRARQVQQRMGSVTDRFSENLAALKEVRAFGLEERETERFRATIRSLFGAQMKVVKYAQALSPTIEFLAALGVSVAFVYAYHVRLPYEVFIAMVSALYFSYDPIKKIGYINSELKKGAAALDRLEAILHAPVTVANAPGAIDAGRLRGDLRFDGVTFAYGNEPVLRDATVDIPAGTICALVGPSGAGKTTFASLVPRFFDPTAGTVSVDGIDLRRFTLASLRRNLALVTQDPVLFNESIAANLRVGRPDATAAQLEAAARDASIHEFIASLPQGYDTVVGERGTLLSGGQKQRLALARAFLRDAPILILDEATSALDTRSEEAIQTALRKLMRGRTVLIVAHRFSTIRDANLVLVFDSGTIVAQGTHAEVYAASPLYRTLHDRQQAA